MVLEEGVGGEREEMEIEEKNKTGSGNVEFTEMSVLCQRAEITLFLSSFYSLFSHCGLVNTTGCVMPCSAKPKMNIQEKKRKRNGTFT